MAKLEARQVPPFPPRTISLKVSLPTEHRLEKNAGIFGPRNEWSRSAHGSTNEILTPITDSDEGRTKNLIEMRRGASFPPQWQLLTNLASGEHFQPRASSSDQRQRLDRLDMVQSATVKRFYEGQFCSEGFDVTKNCAAVRFWTSNLFARLISHSRFVAQTFLRRPRLEFRNHCRSSSPPGPEPTLAGLFQQG